MTVRKIILIICFLFFLYPITVLGLSINYSFVILPVISLLLNPTIKRPKKILMLMMGLYTLIFFITYISQYELIDNVIRRIISFFIFMSIFSYTFITIDDEMIESFKFAIVAIGLFFSFISIYLFFTLGGSNLGFGAKDIVGSQRFGFIYILGIWLIYSHRERKKLYVVIKYLLLLFLLTGLFLTFSRSSIVSLLGSAGIFVLFKYLIWLQKPKLSMIGKALLAVVIMSFLTVLLYKIVPISFLFYQERLFSFIQNPSAVMDFLSNPNTSMGTRVYILDRIFDYFIQNPLTGSGYLGVWILKDNLFGSSHNQYADVLFRTGFYGFLAYISLLVFLIRYLYASNRGLFWGLIGVLIYGMFHETFKESHGGFVLTFLLGMMSQSWRNAKRAAHNKKYIANTYSECKLISENKPIHHTI